MKLLQFIAYARVATLESGQGVMRLEDKNVMYVVTRREDVERATVLLMQISEMLFNLMNNEKSFRIEFKYNPEEKNVEIEAYTTEGLVREQYKKKRTLHDLKKLNNFEVMQFLSDYTYDESIRIYHTLEDFIKNIESEKSVLSEVNESDIEKFLNNKLIREKVILFDLIKKCNECNIETQYAVGEVSMIMSLMIQSNLFKSDSNNKI